jgi:hypothetical protein
MAVLGFRIVGVGEYMQYQRDHKDNQQRQFHPEGAAI